MEEMAVVRSVAEIGEGRDDRGRVDVVVIIIVEDDDDREEREEEEEKVFKALMDLPMKRIDAAVSGVMKSGSNSSFISKYFSPMAPLPPLSFPS